MERNVIFLHITAKCPSPCISNVLIFALLLIMMLGASIFKHLPKLLMRLVIIAGNDSFVITGISCVDNHANVSTIAFTF